MGMTKSPAVDIPADHLEEADDLQERNGKKRTSVDQEEGEGSCIVCRFVLGKTSVQKKRFLSGIARM